MTINIDHTIKCLLAEMLGAQESMVTPDASLRDDLFADGFDLFEIAMALEDMELLPMLVGDYYYEDWNSVQDILDSVKKAREK